MKRAPTSLVVLAHMVFVPLVHAGFVPLELARGLSSASTIRHPDAPPLTDVRNIVRSEPSAYTLLDVAFTTGVMLDLPATVATSHAMHRSSWEAGVLRVRMGGTRQVTASDAVHAQAISESGLTADFILTEPTAAEFSGTLTLDASGFQPSLAFGSVQVYLYRLVDGIPLYVFIDEIAETTDARPVLFSAVLPPGEYRFSAGYALSITANLPQDSGVMSGLVEGVLTIPSAWTLWPLVVGLGGLGRRRRG